MQIPEFFPQGSIRILNRIVVLPFGRHLLTLTDTEFYGGDVIALPDHIEGSANVISGLLICDLTMKVHIVSQNKQLLDIVARYLRIHVLGVIPANIDHLSDNGADDKQRRTVHAGNRIINNNDLFLQLLAVFAAAHQMVEIQKCDKIPFTFTEIFRDFAILTNNLINILYACLSANAETLESGLAEDFIDAVNGSFCVGIVLVKVRNLRS